MANQVRKQEPGEISILNTPCAPVGIFQKALKDIGIDAERLARKLDAQLEAKATRVLILNGQIERVEVDDNESQRDALKQAIKILEFMPKEKEEKGDTTVVVEIAPFKPQTIQQEGSGSEEDES